MIELLTDEEVAARLRCKPKTVQRLRLTGKLPYLPHRPPMVDAADLDAYVEREKRRRAEPVPKSPGLIDDEAVSKQANRMLLKLVMKGTLGARRAK